MDKNNALVSDSPLPKKTRINKLGAFVICFCDFRTFRNTFHLLTVYTIIRKFERK